jgi:hypothetical protein
MANILIYNGAISSSMVSGNTPFGLYDSDLIYQTASANTSNWCANRLGYPIVDIELQSENFFACFEEAVTEYSAQVNRFNIRENLLAAKGNSTSNSYTHKMITPNLGRLIALSKQYGTEVGSGGLVDWKTAYITTSTGSDGAWQQEYDLSTLLTGSDGNHVTADLEVKRVFHQKDPAQARHFDPQFGSNYTLNSFGWGGTMAGVSYLAMPIYDDLLKVQQVEFDDTVRKSHFTFELINNKLRVFPRPSNAFKFYVQYIETETRDTLVTGSAISDYSNFGYDNMTYSNINDPGKQWIRKYTLCLVKQLLGSVRSKYSSIPIPGSETTMDGDTLRSEGAAEAEALIATLREDLEAASRRNLMEKEQEITDFQQGMLNKAPLNIYVG